MPDLARRLVTLLPTDALVTPAVHGVVEAVVAEALGSSGAPDPAVVDATTASMKERLGLMPRFLGTPMAGATVAFDLLGWATAGRPFRRQTAEQRRRHVALWRSAPIGFFRDYLDFWEKMGVFVYFSTLEEREQAHEAHAAGGEGTDGQGGAR